MSLSSPGSSNMNWFAEVPPSEWNLDLFFRHGLSHIPVALVPSGDSSLSLKNPKLLQEQLIAVTNHSREISEVRQFGRTGLLCKSSNADCVRDLLACSSFASQAVRTFIPSHLACVQGVVRDVDKSLTTQEVLDLFAPAGVVAMFRCSRVVDGRRQPTDSIIATFAGHSRPSEIKAWPVLYRVDPFIRKLRQCEKCWRFGHVERNCKSILRCRNCSSGHHFSVCQAQASLCCLCGSTHAADYAECPVRVQESAVNETMDRCHCTRFDAMAMVKRRASEFSAVAARGQDVSEKSLEKIVTCAVDKAVARATELLISSLSSSLSQLISEKVAEVFRTFAPVVLAAKSFTAPSLPSLPSEKLASASAVSMEVVAPVGKGCLESSNPSVPPALEKDNSDLDMDIAPASNKRSASPSTSPSSGSPQSSARRSRKKEKQRMKLKSDILQEAVREIT